MRCSQLGYLAQAHPKQVQLTNVTMRAQAVQLKKRPIQDNLQKKEEMTI